MANVISKQQLIDASWDAETLGHFMNDPADTPNPGFPNGTLFTRTGLLLYNLARLRLDVGAGYLPPLALAENQFLTNNGVSSNWEAVIYELVGFDSTAPVSGTPFINGMFYYNTTDKSLYQYNAGVWALFGLPKQGRDYWFDDLTYRWNGTDLVPKDNKLFTGVWPRPKRISNDKFGTSTETELVTEVIACYLNPLPNEILEKGQIGFDVENFVLKVGNGVLTWDELTLSTTSSGYGNAYWGTVGTYTWQVPVGVYEVFVTMCGGGGGYGSSNSNNYNFVRGWQGGLYYMTKVSVTPKTLISITVGGPGWNTATSTGGSGGASAFGSLLAGGGGGGYRTFADSIPLYAWNPYYLAKLGPNPGMYGYAPQSSPGGIVVAQSVIPTAGAVFVEWGHIERF